MKASIRLLASLLLMLISISIYGQNSKIPFVLTHRSGNLLQTNQNVSFLVKGDTEEIQNAVKSLGGTYRYSVNNIASVALPANQIKSFSEYDFIKEIQFFQTTGQTLNDSALVNADVVPVHNGMSPLTQPYNGNGVVVGIIDAGIDFTHPDFQKSDGTTRIKYLWDQNVTSAPNPPVPYNYGQEWTASDIDNGLCTHVEDPSEFGHGTNVSGIAVGDGSAVGMYKGVATQADIIVVAINFDNDFMTNFTDACDYIFKKADAMGKPCVINSSVGTYVGSHDGQDLSAQVVDGLLAQTSGRVLSQAGGNERTTKFHLGYNVSPVDTHFTWFNYNSTYGDVYFQAWADKANFDNVHFAIGDYDNLNVLDKGRSPFWNILNDFNLTDGGPSEQLNYNLMQNNTLLGQVIITTQLIGGLYSIEVEVLPANTTDYWSFETIGTGKFDVWSKPSLTSSSVMIKPPLLPDSVAYPRIVNYEIPDTFQTIVSSWGCSDKVITVANYVNRNTYLDVDTILRTFPEVHENIAVSSSTGPTRDGRQKPDLAASGQGTITSGNMVTIAQFLGNSNRYKVGLGGMHNTNGGTSMASPIVAGICALYLQMNPTATWQEIKLALTQTARQDSFTTAQIPNWSWGYGKVDAFNAMTQANIVYGCTNPASLNYNPNANVDDGSCIAVVYGCMDSTALNYNPLANVDDASCVYDTADTNVIVVLPQSKLKFSCYPNPSHGEVVFEYSMNQAFENAEIEIFNSLGQKVDEIALPSDRGSFVYKNQLVAGIYHYSLIVNDRRLYNSKLVVY